METGELIVLLMSIPSIGERTLGTILRRTATAGIAPTELLSMPAAAVTCEFGIPRSTAELLNDSSKRAGASLQYRNLTRAGARIVTFLDASYPRKLAERMESPPPVLFAYGNQSLLDSALFAVANSNGAGEDALAAGDRAAETLLEAGYGLVTGHNRVAYQRPALVMRRNGGHVCYVLDRGIVEGFGGDLTRALFPAARIWGPAFDPEGDLAISPFAPDAHGIAANNRKRDSLVFALADLIVACHIRPGGRMESECLAALGRTIPVQIAQGQSLAAPLLMERGAQPMRVAD